MSDAVKDLGLTVEVPEWCDVLMEYGFCNGKAIDIMQEALKRRMLMKNGYINQSLMKKFVLHMYRVDTNPKAALVYDVIAVLGDSDLCGNPMRDDNVMNILVAFDYAFAVCIEQILS